jgi:hypothetical protein
MARTRRRVDSPRVVLPGAQPTRIDGVTIIDPRDGAATPGMSVLMRNGRIATVAPVGTVSVDDGVRVLDGAGRYAVPGYNNMHTHALQADRPALMMATMLAEGVTTGRRRKPRRHLRHRPRRPPDHHRRPRRDHRPLGRRQCRGATQMGM